MDAMIAYDHLADFHIGDVSVSPLLRHLLERTANLRHAECCFVNRKIFRTTDLADMNLQDIGNLTNEVKEIWTALRWNTSRLSGLIVSLFEEAKSMPSKTQDVFAHASVSLSHESLSGMSCSHNIRNADTLLRFSKYFSQSSAAVPEQFDSASAVNHGQNVSEVMQSLVKHVDAAKHLLMKDRFERIIEQVQVSDAHAAESAAALARALEIADEVPLPIDEPLLSDERNPRKILKNAKLSLRNVLLWACIGWAKGLDSLEAVENRFPQNRQAKDTRAQLLNGFKHLRQTVSMQLTGQDHTVPLAGSKPKRPKRDSIEKETSQHATMPLWVDHNELSSLDPEVCVPSNFGICRTVGGPTAHGAGVYSGLQDHVVCTCTSSQSGLL